MTEQTGNKYPNTHAMSPAFIYLGGTACAIALLLLMFAHSWWAVRRAAPQRAQHAALVEELSLTDLCLFTDARYTRHPSMADLHSAFQDHPLSIDHFPSGSVIGPPPHLETASRFIGRPGGGAGQ